MGFNLDETDSVEDVRYNERLECNQYLYDGKWYEEDDLIDYLSELDRVSIETARGFVSIYDLELHFPVENYISNDDDEDDDEE